MTYNVSPKVSIVLPSFNGSEYIRQSIESCLKQTYKNIELIIVDDGSTDETPRIVQSFKDERIRYIRHDKNLGLPRALNRGFSQVGGEYLTWTSDDNYYAEEAIEEMVFFLKDGGRPFVYCDFYAFEDNDPEARRLVKLPEKPAFDQINSVGPCFLYAKEVRQTIGDYNPDTALVEDYDYWIRVAKRFPLSHLAKPLYYYRFHGRSLYCSRNHEVKLMQLLVRLRYSLMEPEKIKNSLFDLFADKKNGAITFKGSYPLYKLLARMLFSRKIDIILTDFQRGKIAIGKANLDLKNIIETKLLGIL